MDQTMKRVFRAQSGKRAQRRVSLLLSRSRRILERKREQAQRIDNAGPEAAKCEACEMKRLHRTFRLLDDALRESEQERCQRLSVALHDLKSPLMVAGSAARQLRTHEWTEQDREAWLDSIIRNVTSMEVLVRDLLDEARETAGEHTEANPLEAVDLVALAREIVREYGAVVDSHTLKFAGDEARDCTVSGNAEDLRRLLLNLVSNAVKYSDAGREVCVSVWQHDGNVSLIVEDEGRGLLPSKTERLFQPFVRLDETRDMAEGDGLGLASVKRIADAHGAEIAVEGAPGQGTTFEVKFAAQGG